MEIKAVQVFTPEDCLTGSCGCESPADCKFSRCAECDSIVDENGLSLDDTSDGGEDYCEECGAKL